MMDTSAAARHRDPRAHEPSLTAMLTMARRINVTPERMAAVLEHPELPESLRHVDLGAAGWLDIANPPVPAEYRVAWLARGRLQGRGLRIVAYSRVEIEISAASAASCNLVLLPTCRHASQWGARRLRRYVALANEASDYLARTLGELAVKPPVAVGGRPRGAGDEGLVADSQASGPLSAAVAWGPHMPYTPAPGGVDTEHSHDAGSLVR